MRYRLRVSSSSSSSSSACLLPPSHPPSLPPSHPRLFGHRRESRDSTDTTSSGMASEQTSGMASEQTERRSAVRARGESATTSTAASTTNARRRRATSRTMVELNTPARQRSTALPLSHHTTSSSPAPRPSHARSPSSSCLSPLLALVAPRCTRCTRCYTRPRRTHPTLALRSPYTRLNSPYTRPWSLSLFPLALGLSCPWTCPYLARVLAPHRPRPSFSSRPPRLAPLPPLSLQPHRLQTFQTTSARISPPRLTITTPSLCTTLTPVLSPRPVAPTHARSHHSLATTPSPLSA